MEKLLISIRRAGREIDLVPMPMADHADGLVRYRNRLWRPEGGIIDLDGPAVPSSAGEPEPKAGASQNEVDTQAVVVRSDPNRRLVVDAGPGTGKTWTACARVADLIGQNIPASKIWMISFTRTAVLEIRQRIAGFTGHDEAAAVRVSTLDAHAWSLQSGFDDEAVLSGSHDDGIMRTLDRLESDPDLQDYLGRVRHLIVDESQDIVGVRAGLVAALVRHLRPDAGVTIFADPAQAIYGFTEDEGMSGAGPSLLDLLPADFDQMSLSEIRRTRCPRLRELFTQTRRKVLSSLPAKAKSARVREDIERLAHRQLEVVKDGGISYANPDALILYRRRADVLAAASHAEGRHFRLRMSGLPTPLVPWLGRVFWDFTERRIGESAFMDRALDRGLQPSAVEQEWKNLLELAGDSGKSVDLHRLRSLLSRSSPPLLVSLPEFGEAGPVLGTIHASKGREADDVHLWLSPLDEDSDETQDAHDEETRVMFVGATRARLRLFTGTAPTLRARSEGGRVWRKTRKGVQVEIGRSGDVDLPGLVGKSSFADRNAAAAAQTRVSNSARQPLRAFSIADLDWNFSLETEERGRLCVLSQGLRNDLRSIANRCQQWPPPGQLNWLISLGARTVCAPPDDGQLDLLHEPWRSSGFALAPMLIGFSATTFFKKKKT